MEWLNKFMENWEVIVASAGIVLAGADKIALVLFQTIGNIRKHYRDMFPREED